MKLNKQSFVLSVKGFCMGIADIIPGISGGTMALILGIYEDLIAAIKSFDLSVIKDVLTFKFNDAFQKIHWRFLFPLLTGIIIAILILSKIMHWLLEHKPSFVYAFFFGLILAMVPMMCKIVKKWDNTKIICLVLAAIGFYYFVGITPVQTPESWWFIALSGALAICAMILPGISGSFILVILGKYGFILEAIANYHFGVLAIFIGGILIGIFSFVRVVSWLLNHFHDITLAILTGVVIGSLRKIWPWKDDMMEVLITAKGKVIPIVQENVFPSELNMEVMIAIGLAALGFIIAQFLNQFNQGSSHGH